MYNVLLNVLIYCFFCPKMVRHTLKVLQQNTARFLKWCLTILGQNALKGHTCYFFVPILKSSSMISLAYVCSHYKLTIMLQTK